MVYLGLAMFMNQQIKVKKRTYGDEDPIQWLVICSEILPMDISTQENFPVLIDRDRRQIIIIGRED